MRWLARACCRFNRANHASPKPACPAKPGSLQNPIAEFLTWIKIRRLAGRRSNVETRRSFPPYRGAGGPRACAAARNALRQRDPPAIQSSAIQGAGMNQPKAATPLAATTLDTEFKRGLGLYDSTMVVV